MISTNGFKNMYVQNSYKFFNLIFPGIRFELCNLPKGILESVLESRIDFARFGMGIVNIWNQPIISQLYLAFISIVLISNKYLCFVLIMNEYLFQSLIWDQIIGICYHKTF